MTMTTLARQITGGVDTHLDVHVAAALDERGGLLGVESFETTPAGYDKLLTWLQGFGTVELLGVEGTGSYGAGLTRHLHSEGIRVVEVDRPNRQRRRRHGKSDPQDAISAARAAQGGDATGEAKTRDGNVEAMRVLRVARASARKGRTQALNQMRSLISTGHQTGPGVDQQVDTADAGASGHRTRGGDQRDRCRLEANGERDRTRALRPLRSRNRHRLCAPSGRRRQSGATPQRSELRPPLRHQSHRCQ